MKYVRPYALFKQIEKMNMELAQKKALRAQLLGVNVLDDYVTVAISDAVMKSAAHHAVLERKRRNINTIANIFQTLIPKFNLEGVVIGCPDAKYYNLESVVCQDVQNIENREVAKVGSFVYDLCNTGKLDGFKYTCWDWRFGPQLLNWVDPDIEDYENKSSSVFMLQVYLYDCRRKVNPRDCVIYPRDYVMFA